MLSLSQGFVINLGALGTMGWILWHSAGPVSFTINGSQLTIPGYLFWLAIFWGVLRTAATHLAGHRLARLTVEQQTFEADFRFSLSLAREASEQIALYRGQAVEQGRLQQLFGEIQRNWSHLMRHNVYLNLTSTGFSVVSVLVPIIAVSPRCLPVNCRSIAGLHARQHCPPHDAGKPSRQAIEPRCGGRCRRGMNGSMVGTS
jgi:vitamin B12/bleomycin/antimicrobial peptide transport system ATP-binding/permease protein